MELTKPLLVLLVELATLVHLRVNKDKVITAVLCGGKHLAPLLIRLKELHVISHDYHARARCHFALYKALICVADLVQERGPNLHSFVEMRKILVHYGHFFSVENNNSVDIS